MNKKNLHPSVYLSHIFHALLLTMMLQVDTYAQTTTNQEGYPDPFIDIEGISNPLFATSSRSPTTATPLLIRTDYPLDKKNPVTSLLSFTPNSISSSICVEQGNMSGCATNAIVHKYKRDREGFKYKSICAIAEGPTEYLYSSPNNLILTARNIYFIDREYKNNQTYLLFARSTHMNLTPYTHPPQPTLEHNFLQRLEEKHFDSKIIKEAETNQEYGEVALRLSTAESHNSKLPVLPNTIDINAKCFLVATRNVVVVGNSKSPSIYRFNVGATSNPDSPFNDIIKVDPSPIKTIINVNKNSSTELDSNVTHMIAHEDGRVFVKTQKSVWIFGPDGELITVEDHSAIN